MRIPADTFRLFVTSGIVNARFGALLAAVHTLAVAVLGTCAVTGTLTFNGRKLLRFAIITMLLTAGVVGGTRVLLQGSAESRVRQGPDADRHGTAARSGDRHRCSPAVPRAAAAGASRPPSSIGCATRGVLRVGYFEDSLPYAFFNRRGELVGFDVEMALQLARDLGVTAELVPVEPTVLDDGLDPGGVRHRHVGRGR